MKNDRIEVLVVLLLSIVFVLSTLSSAATIRYSDKTLPKYLVNLDEYGVDLKLADYENTIRYVMPGDKEKIDFVLTNTGTLDDTYDVQGYPIEVGCFHIYINGHYWRTDIPLSSGESITLQVELYVQEYMYVVKEWPMLLVADSTNDSEVTDQVDVMVTLDDAPPNPPEINGPTSGDAGEYYTYNFKLTDPDEHPLELLEIDWGEGSIEEYTPQGCDCGSFWNNGEIVPIDKKWRRQGSYSITARVRDATGLWSGWSDPYPVSMPRIRLLQNHLLQRLINLFPILEQILS